MAPAAAAGPDDEVRGARRVALGASLLETGAGSLRRLGSVAADLGIKRVLLVTDDGIVAAGHAARALRSLEEAGVAASIFDRVRENPTTAHVDEGLRFARREATAGATPLDGIVGLGGGSSMDCAKGINFLLTNGGRMEDYWGMGKAKLPMLPSIGVPCTAGTGSEAQSFALIAQVGSHLKMACGDPKARFRAVILDPELIVTAPYRVAVDAGYDALSHTVESFVTRRRNPLSRSFARSGFRLLARRFTAVAERAATIVAWDDMLWGAHLAGLAIETSMLGAAHACANPLTARYQIVHGRAVGLTLPTVVRRNAEREPGLYEELEGELDRTVGGGQDLAGWLEAARERGGMPSRLRDLGVPREALDELTALALDQWTLQHNPVPLAAADVQSIYEAIW